LYGGTAAAATAGTYTTFGFHNWNNCIYVINFYVFIWDNSLRVIIILLNPLYVTEVHMSIT
jgi:hypothetical protein